MDEAEAEVVTEAPEGETPAETGAIQAELEGRARRMGWRPKEEFRGDPHRWTDAQSFIERGEAELPVLRERYRTLDDRFARSEGELRQTRDQVSEMTKVLNEFRDFSARAEQRAYSKARSELERQMEDAAAGADQAGYRRAKAEFDALEPPKPVAAVAETPPKKEEAPPAQRVEPVVQSWVQENEWFNRDPILNAYATARHGQLLTEKPGLSLSENLAEVRREVIDRFPDKFGNPKRERPQVVATPASPPPRKQGGKTFEDLPVEARAAYERAKRWMPDYKKEEYLKTYFAGDDV